MKRFLAIPLLGFAFLAAGQDASVYHASKSTLEKESPDTVILTPFDVTFSVIESATDGKPLASHEFRTRLVAGTSFHACQIRAEQKIPVPAGKTGQYTYLDVRVNFDCEHARVQDGLLIMQLSGALYDISNRTARAEIQQQVWSGLISVRPGEKTLVYSTNDSTAKKRIEVYVLAVPVNGGRSAGER